MNLEPKYYYPWSQIKQNQPTEQDMNKKYKQIDLSEKEIINNKYEPNK